MYSLDPDVVTSFGLEMVPGVGGAQWVGPLGVVGGPPAG